MNFAQILCELASESPKYETKDIFNKVEEDLGEDAKDDEKLTAYVLKQMMLENTGRHMLDSGGMGGRRWERMQLFKDLDWTKAKRTITNVDRYSKGEYYVYITKNTYLFLLEYITYDREADKCFHAFCNSEEHKKESYYSNMSSYVELIRSFAETNDLDYTSYGSHNTYNGESCLDTTLQWEHFSVKRQDYIILQTHNGADVRGGYSTPHIFSLCWDDMVCRIDDLSAKCPNHGIEPEKVSTTVQLTLEGQVADMTPMDHIDCYSDDCGNHWYGSGGSVDWVYTTDEEDNHHAVCPKCGAEIEFYG